MLSQGNLHPPKINSLKILTSILGPLQTNVYSIFSNNNLLIIDPAGIPPFLQNSNCQKIKANFFITHAHYDHVDGIPKLISLYPNSKIFISPKDIDLLLEIPSIKIIKNDIEARLHFVYENDHIFVNPSQKSLRDQLNVINLSGHTKGSLGLYCPSKKCVFVGDALFKKSIGSVSQKGILFQMVDKILKNIMTLPKDTIIYPGHGPSTTIGDEMLYNPFIHHLFI